MSTAFTLREMVPADNAALVALTEQSPDGGRIAFRPHFYIDPLDVYKARHGDIVGVVAEAPNAAGLVGAAHVSFGEFQFEGALRPYALLSSLMVHPDFRRQGIATALAAWRIARAEERSGPDIVMLADIQTGNVGSTANARRWATHIGGKIVTTPTPMRSRPPRKEAFVVRTATPDDLEAIADHLNRFYDSYNLYRPQSAERLDDWLHSSPLPTPVNHYLVATDRANRLLAGMGIREETRLMSLKIERVPPLIAFANRFLHVIPPDREMRNLQVEMLWFAPDQLQAARHLWQTVRYEWRERGSSLLCAFDPRGPIPQVLQNPPWMPTTTISVAVRAPIPMSEARLLDPFN